MQQVLLHIADTPVVATMNDKGVVIAVHTTDGRPLGESYYSNRKELFAAVQRELRTKEILNV